MASPRKYRRKIKKITINRAKSEVKSEANSKLPPPGGVITFDKLPSIRTEHDWNIANRTVDYCVTISIPEQHLSEYGGVHELSTILEAISREINRVAADVLRRHIRDRNS